MCSAVWAWNHLLKRNFLAAPPHCSEAVNLSAFHTLSGAVVIQLHGSLYRDTEPRTFAGAGTSFEAIFKGVRTLSNASRTAPSDQACGLKSIK